MNTPLTRAQASLIHHHHAQYLEDVPFWLEVVRLSGDPVLELGCGSGRVTLPLVGAGHKVIGLDREAAMLAWMNDSRASDQSALPLLIRADFLAFRLAVGFRTILMPCNILSTVPTDDRPALLDLVRAHLHPQGRFVASQSNPALLASLPVEGPQVLEETFTDPFSGDPVQVSSGWRRTAQGVTITWTYDRLLSDGQVLRHQVHNRHRLMDITGWQGALEGSGLRLLEAFGDYDRSPYAEASPYLVLVAGHPD